MSGIFEIAGVARLIIALKKVFSSCVLICCLPVWLIAQGEVVKAVQMDSVTIEAVNRGFNVADFIGMVRADTSFYQAFKNLHYYPYSLSSRLLVFDKNGKINASQFREAQQYVHNQKKWVVINDEQVEGNFYKRKKKYRFYTAELLDEIFFNVDTLPASNKINTNFDDLQGASNIDKLKILMFNPGANIQGIPGAGRKLAIFDDRMAKYYNYYISTELYKDSVPCYVFLCKIKDMADFDNGNVVIRELKTYFDKRNFRIASRNYDMGYRSVFFDFDVSIDVHHILFENQLVPEAFSYRGYWKIVGKKPERVRFNVSLDNYQIR